MAEVLVWEDYLTIGIYFILVLALGLWTSITRQRDSTQAYFLAGKNMIWFGVGASVYASNVGAPMFIGLAGTAAKSGIAVTIYEWHAVYIVLALGWFFVPVYIASGAYTTPEYLRMRFGGKRIQMCTSVMMLLSYILRTITGELFCGAVFMQQLLGWNIYISVSAILVVVALYTVVGGLRAVIFTDTLQIIILLIGTTAVFILSYIEVGGWDRMEVKYMTAAKNYTYTNTSVYGCGLPRDDSFHIFRDAVTGDIPWPGATFGLTILALFVWCQDQLMVQRCLSAKNIANAKGGTLFAAALKLLSLPLFVVPGMISRILFTDEVACANPEDCIEVCGNPAGCSNIAYPLLVLRILPKGIRGLMLAAVLAGLMSTLTSVFNSASSLVTLDLWAQFRKNASQKELMIVGRVTVLVLVVISVLWLPILQHQQGGIFWFYVAAITAYFTAPWCIAFLMGLFYKRATEPGVFWGLVIGLLIGIIRMCLDFSTPGPNCGSGDPDTRMSIITKVDFLHFAIINAIVIATIMIVISLFTKPREENQLRRTTFWTRHEEEDPDLTDDESDDHGKGQIEVSDEGTCEKKLKFEDNQTDHTFFQRCGHHFRDWLCGAVEDNTTHISKEERKLIRQKMTSIKEGPWTSAMLNGTAIFLIIVVTFLFGLFA